ncbi:AMP-dependent synthetase and ligase [Burkholderia sp. H160]|nr:AMP-dependent synthetase and ligase [Burkholderia sp. H160]
MVDDTSRPVAGDTLWGLLESRALQSPRDTMLVDALTGREISFAEFHASALECASWLHHHGVQAGSVVAWQLPTRIDSAVVCWALARLGATQVPVIHAYREREIREVTRQSRPAFFITPSADASEDYTARVARAVEGESELAILVVPERWAPIASSLPPAPGAIDGTVVRWHYYTSGTSSRPKAVLHTDHSLMAAGRGMATLLGMRSDDIGSVGYPFAHVGGVAYLAASLGVGASVVLLERFIPSEAVSAYRRYGVTFGGGSTAHYQALLAEQRRRPGITVMPALKVLAGGGASKPATLFHQVKQELGCAIVHAYGLTEAPISTFNSPDDSDEQLANSDGIPIPGVELRIARTDGSVAEPGESGEILVRGPNVCRGYLDETLTRDLFDEHGFLRTGDVGYIRPDGRLRVTGRIKDVIIRKGENITALEIEELLLTHPKVRDVAVIGLPDDERGERVCAVVVPHNASDALSFGEMQTFLAERRLMKQKFPEQLEIMASLPRNEALQKVMKSELRKMLMAQSTART